MMQRIVEYLDGSPHRTASWSREPVALSERALVRRRRRVIEEDHYRWRGFRVPAM
jgi:hypothetical protein